MQEIQQRLGEKIRKLRSEKGFSQESFADECRLHRTYMGSIERGERNVTLKSLRTIATALGVTVSELLNGIA